MSLGQTMIIDQRFVLQSVAPVAQQVRGRIHLSEFGLSLLTPRPLTIDHQPLTFRPYKVKQQSILLLHQQRFLHEKNPKYIRRL